MRQDKILILGGAGFIGSNLARELVAQGYRPRIFTRSAVRNRILLSLHDSIDVIFGDFLDDVALAKAMQGVETVYHLITTTFPNMTIESGVYDAFSNLIPTVRMLEYCRQFGVRKVIYASSGGTVYGEPRTLPIPEDHPLEPKSLYGLSKATIENYFKFFSRVTGLEVNIARISNPYGPGQNPFGTQGIIPVAMGCILNGQPFGIYGTGEHVRDYLYITDAVRALTRLLHHNASCTVNISAGSGLSVSEILNNIEAVTGKKIEKQFLPPRPGDTRNNVLDNSRAGRLLNWYPIVSLSEGIKETWEHIYAEYRNT